MVFRVLNTLHGADDLVTAEEAEGFHTRRLQGSVAP
jgi:hypothetical protein